MVHTYLFEFEFLSIVLGLILKFVWNLSCNSGVQIIPRVRGNKLIELLFCLLLEFYWLIGWLVRQDQIDFWFKLILRTAPKLFPIIHPISILLLFHQSINSLSNSKFQSELENEISLLSTFFTTLETLFYSSPSSEILNSWKCWISFPLFYLINFCIFFQLEHLNLSCPMHIPSNSLYFLCLLTKTLQLLQKWHD